MMIPNAGNIGKHNNCYVFLLGPRGATNFKHPASGFLEVPH